MPDSERPRYAELAERIAAMVEAGTLPPGSRIPSLRETCVQQGVSLSTALHAYRVLERRGVLESRPKSGYYVSAARRPALAAPSRARVSRRPVDVSVSAVVKDLLQYVSDPSLVPLGCAIPGAELLAAGRLDRHLARAARVKGRHCNVYTLAGGDPALRQAIAQRAFMRGRSLAPEEMAITCGCTEAITLALSAVARPGDAIAVESPTYFGLLHTLETLGLRALEIPCDPRAGLDLPALERALASGTVKVCLFSSTFNNPLGCANGEEMKKAVLELVARHRAVLIEDDTYGDLPFSAERPRPYHALDRRGVTIHCSSFSKTIAPGYRIGWIAGGRWHERILERKIAFTLAGPALTQVAFADYLAAGEYDRHLRRLREVFRTSIERAMEAVGAAFPPGTRVAAPQGGFVLWVELPPPLDSAALLEAALERGICFAPGPAFSASGRYRHCLRLSLGYGWSRRIEEGLLTVGGLAARLLNPGRPAR